MTTSAKIRSLIAAMLMVLGLASTVYAQMVTPPSFGAPTPIVTATTQFIGPATPTDCSVPQYSFAGDSNTGVGYSGADAGKLCAGAAAIAQWTTSQFSLGTNIQAVFTNGAGIELQLSGAGAAGNIAATADLFILAGNGGSGGAVDIGGTNTNSVVRVSGAAGFIFPTDNTYDIGASGATRPRSIFVGTNGTFGSGVGIGTTPPSAGLALGATNSITWAGNFALAGQGVGLLGVTNAGGTAGVGFDVATDGVLRVKNRTQNANATITALQGLFTQDTLGNNVQQLITVATNDDPTENTFQQRATTTDATPTTINTITIATSFETFIACRVVARRTGGVSGAAEDGGAYEVLVAVKNTAGTVAELGAEIVTTVGESTAGFNVTAAPSGATELIQVTGAATTNITWHSTCRSYAVGQ